MPPLAEYHGPDTQGPDTQGPDAQAPLLARYEALLALTEQMLSLAADHAWDELIAVEGDYVSQVAALDSPALDGAAPMAGLEADERQRLGTLLEAILVNDLALREQLVHRRDELGELLKVSRNQQDLHRAYAGGRVVNAGTRFRRETP